MRKKSNYISRRFFIAGLSIGLGLFLQNCKSNKDIDNAISLPFPAHQSTLVTGVHAYSQKQLKPGDELHLRVSSTVPYELSIVRLGSDPDSMEKDITLFSTSSEPIPQPIYPGSYINITKGLANVKALTLECWVRAFDIRSRQGLITQSEEKDELSYGIYLNKGVVELKIGNHVLQTPLGYIIEKKWHHVVATWDGSKAKIHIDGFLVADALYAKPLLELSGNLKLAASSLKGKTNFFYDGDLANCLVYNRALNKDEIIVHNNSMALSNPAQSGLLAHWKFSEEKGAIIADESKNNRTGQIINNATWMIGGPSFNDKRGPRLNPNYQPYDDPTRGHALRFASDDLYDCRWKISHKYKIPKDARQGFYVARFKFKIDGQLKYYNNTFVVSRPTKKAAAPILVLASTNTWIAYNSYPFAANVKAGLTNWRTGDVKKLSKPEYPGFSQYQEHRAGQPTFQSGVNMPWPNAGPYKTYYEENNTFSQWTRGERFIHLWLEENNYSYDLLTDTDIDKDPEILKDYKTVFLLSHSEYWTEKAYLGVQNYLSEGGTITALSGNSMFWRVSFDEGYNIMECRKFPGAMAASKATQVGHIFHSQDGKRGSLMRYCEMPAWKLIGLETLGWKSQSKDFQSYTVIEPDHFLFNTPNKIDVKKGDLMGEPNLEKQFLGAVGHEYDVRLPVLQSIPPRDHTVPQFLNLKEPRGIVSLARSYNKNRNGIDYIANNGPIQENPSGIISEIIYWQREDGGQVFNVGSVAAPWAVYKDDKMSLLLKNVLHHFGINNNL
ncbi:MAG: hypothetical protein L3J29_01380 [Cyclobacteriaceae bacterium]|nr:hypothetical protein [Cyclobacteriaceae bacterium]